MENQTVSEIQKRRADNIIWNCAGDYSFAPDFIACGSDGSVDLFWNIIFGAARRHYEYAKLEKLFAMLDGYKRSAFFQTLFWNALEPILYAMELKSRPILAKIRPEPAESELQFNADMTTDEIVENATRFFYEEYGLRGDGKIRLHYRLLHLRRFSVDSFLQRGMFIIHEKGIYHGENIGWDGDYSLSTKMNESQLRDFLETKFGRSILPIEQVAQLEKKLCTGNHKFTHLFYTKGEVVELHGIYSTFEMHQRKRQAELIAGNRSYYQCRLQQNRLQIARLSTAISNSLLLHMLPAEVKANSGSLNASLAWRAVKLNDAKVFSRIENANAGDISVDILLDASHSQYERAAKISSQAYIISEALRRCRVPCRVMSFCSMSGFTVLRLFREYSSGDSSNIFDYYTEGCNRDGLAIRAAGDLISKSSYEHKMLIILSDVKPLDAAAKIRRDEMDIGFSYDGVRALTDTAHEVRRIRAEGVSVICVFTGEDENLPAAKLVYGRDFSYFADAVGKLIIDQIKAFSA